MGSLYRLSFAYPAIDFIDSMLSLVSGSCDACGVISVLLWSSHIPDIYVHSFNDMLALTGPINASIFIHNSSEMSFCSNHERNSFINVE